MAVRGCDAISTRIEVLRKLLFTVIAAAFLSGCVSDDGPVTRTVAPLDFGGKGKGYSTSYYYQAQTSRVVASCMPGRLLAVLGHIRERTGVRPVLTSGHRTGGRKGSMHRKCLAADIRVPGVPDSKVIEIAKSSPGIGGVGRYCNGIIHVDVGPRRQWSHCVGQRKGLARLSNRG